MHVWWFNDDWWILMMHVDCTVYDSIAVLGFLCFFESKSEIPPSKWKFSHLVISKHFSKWSMHRGITCVAHIAWPGQQYSLRMTNAVGWPPTMSFVAKRLKERPQAARDLLVTAKWDKFMQSHVWNQNRNNWCGTFIIEHLFVISKLVV